MFSLLQRKLHVIAALGIVATSLYFLARIMLLSLAHYNSADRLLGLLLLLSESFILLHAVGFAANILKIRSVKGSPDDNEPPLKQYPPVAVVVAARHEPMQVLEDTFTTLSNLSYPNKTLYLLDDSSDQRYKNEAEIIGRKYGVEIFRRSERHGAKAGIINDALRNMDAKYLAVFDADQNPMPDFLNRTVSFLESDSKLAFVQTPQVYTNIAKGPVPEGAAMQQSIFYENICEGKNTSNAMFCCGTNVVFRVSMLREIGGFDESSITEDFATSIKFHMRGYKSLYYNRACAFGMAPETLPEYFKQQARWAGGTVGMLRRFLAMLPFSFHRLTPWQWWEYFLAGSYYLIGWAYLVLIMCPVLYLVFNVPSFFLDSRVYVTTFVPYLALSMMIFFGTMHERKYTLKQVYLGIVLGYLTFPVLMKAALLGLFGRKMTFQVTQKGGSEVFPLARLWPYTLLIAVNLLAFAAGVFRFGENPPAMAVNMFWALFHSFILAHIFRFNREPSERFLA